MFRDIVYSWGSNNPYLTLLPLSPLPSRTSKLVDKYLPKVPLGRGDRGVGSGLEPVHIEISNPFHRVTSFQDHSCSYFETAFEQRVGLCLESLLHFVFLHFLLDLRVNHICICIELIDPFLERDF